MRDSLRDDDSAIIGLAGRFPGAPDVDTFWRNLVGGVESITFRTDDELRAAGVPDDRLDDPQYIKAVPLLDQHVELFDAQFFGFTPREAEIRDPQHRLFLETAHAALEHAGYGSPRYRGHVGVFGGTAANVYAHSNLRRNKALLATTGIMPIEVSNNPDYLATTVSYKLGLGGPSLTVATACSTSLVAVHLADQSLRNGECDMALAGGVEIEMPYGHGYWWAEGSIFSRDGHCRSFDAGASGTIFGNGVGVVVLKRLADAVADGDEIYAVIRGTAVNNDGAQRAGFTAPGLEGQRMLIAEALAAAEVHPSTVSYVEAHGTGTLVGDPIEVEALTSAFRAAGADGTGYCAIGSVKSNVGHLGPAAGVTGLIKTALAMRHGTLPPSINFDQPNPKIDFASSPFYVNTECRPWKSNGTPRRAGVSSFGIGGTNAHVVIEEPPRREPSGPTRSWQLLTVSARNDNALRASRANLAEHLAEHSDIGLGDVAYTLHVGRTAHELRSAVVASTAQHAAERLRKPVKSHGRRGGRRPTPVRHVAYLFPGQGAQYPGMAAELYETEPVFRAEVDGCAELLRPHIGLDLRDVLFGAADETARRLAQTELTQPALFTAELALARLWMSWGVEPVAMLGHSVGEYVAACLAGVFTVPDALELVAARGALMQSMPAGAMVSVSVAEEHLKPLLGHDVTLAAVNAPDTCVVAGSAPAVEDFVAFLAEQGIQSRRLKTSHAFHSHMMDPVVEPFRERVAGVALRAPAIPFVSNVTGTWITDEQATDPGYWATHLRRTVRFADGLATLIDEPDWALLEVGPGQVLSALARRHPAVTAGDRVAVASMRHHRQRDPDVATILSALGRLWEAGIDPDWPAFWRHERRRRIALPTYAYQRQAYWVEPDPVQAVEAKPAAAARRPIDEAIFEPTWRPARLEATAVGVPAPGPWLLFARDEATERLGERLRELGAEVTTVVAGDAFAAHGGGRYSVRPTERSDYDELFNVIASDGAELPAQIVHAWTYGPPAADPLSPATVRTAEALGFYGVLALTQAVAKRYGSREVGLTLVSSHLHDVTGQDTVEPGKATLLGPFRLIPRELPNIACRTVDFQWSAETGAPADRFVDQLLAEIAAPPHPQPVAYRGARRWVCSYDEIAVPAGAGNPDLLRPGGVYLVTGGLGGIGLAVAEELARRMQARLVLLQRSAFPAREDWVGHVAAFGERDATSQRIRKLQAIEALGAQVMVVSADVAVEDQLAAAIATAQDAYGPINGVFHAAGVAGGGMMAVKDPADAVAVLAPKVTGTLLIDRMIGDQLDFMVLFSSIVAISGDYGLVDYCAANNFQDAFAQARWAAGRMTFSIDWAAWSEIGMAEVAAAAAPSYLNELRGGTRFAPCDHPLLDRRLLDSTGDVTFSTTFEPTSHWFLTEHQMDGHPVLPGTAYLELVRAAFVEANGDESTELRDVVFLGPLTIDDRREVRTVLRPLHSGWWEFTVFSVGGTQGAAGLTEYARGKVGSFTPAKPAPARDLAAIQRACSLGEHIPPVNDGPSLMTVGPRWQGLGTVLYGDREEFARLELAAAFAGDCGEYVLHPALVDLATSFAQYLPKAEGRYLPFAYDRVTVYRPIPPKCYTHIRHTDTGAGEIITSDIALLDETGAVLVDIGGFAVRRVNPEAIRAGLAAPAPASDAAAATSTKAGAASTQPGRDPNQGLEYGIDPAEGVDALMRVLHRRVGPQVVVCPEGVDRKIARTASLTQDVLTASLADLRLGSSELMPRTLDTPCVAPETNVERTLAQFWQEALGVSEVGVEDSFFELGGDSLVAVQLGSRIREHFRVELPIAAMFDSPNIRTLAVAIEKAMADLVDSLSDEEVAVLLSREPDGDR